MKLIPTNPVNYTKGRTKPISYIVIHYTGNNGDTAAGNGKYFSEPGRGASAHYFADENELIQTVSDTDTAWHCGVDYSGGKAPFWGKCLNANSIGIEMCSRKDNQGAYCFKPETERRAARLAAELSVKYNVPAGNIVRHFDVCGKNCPAPYVKNEKLWEGFLTMVHEETRKILDKPSDWAADAWEWAKSAGITDGTRPKDAATREEVITLLYNFSRKGVK